MNDLKYEPEEFSLTKLENGLVDSGCSDNIIYIKGEPLAVKQEIPTDYSDYHTHGSSEGSRESINSEYNDTTITDEENNTSYIPHGSSEGSRESIKSESSDLTITADEENNRSYILYGSSESSRESVNSECSDSTITADEENNRSYKIHGSSESSRESIKSECSDSTITNEENNRSNIPQGSRESIKSECSDTTITSEENNRSNIPINFKDKSLSLDEVFLMNTQYKEHGTFLRNQSCSSSFTENSSSVWKNSSHTDTLMPRTLESLTLFTKRSSTTGVLQDQVPGIYNRLILSNAAGREQETRFTCLLCCNTYNKKQSLEEHISSLHSGHLLSNTSDTESKYLRIVIHDFFNCLVCCQSYDRKRTQQQHISSHSDLPHSDTSDIKFTNPRVIIHDILDSLVCCKKRYDSIRKLKEHLSSNHGGFSLLNNADNRFTCQICSNTYRHKRGLQRHMLGVHSRVSITPTTKTRKFNHRGYSKFHNGHQLILKVLLNCKICCTILHKKPSLNVHEKMHVSETRSLHDISKSFTGCKATNQKCSLIVKKQYVCDICLKGFTSSSKLTFHKRSHTAKKLVHTEKMPYRCEFCNKRFRWKYNRDRHKRTHA